MTHREICELIVRQGNCAGIRCIDDNCPFNHDRCTLDGNLKNAKQWLEKHKENPMDKSEVMKRLDAIETEAKALREIIEKAEKADKVQFDSSKVYIGIRNGCPYIMVGNDMETTFRFNSFDVGNKTCIGWCKPKPSAEDCLDYHIDAGFTIHAFDTAREAFEFFLKHL